MEHYPFQYADDGTVCVCGSMMRADETCPDDATRLDPNDPRTWPVDLSEDPSEVVVISQAPGLYAQRLPAPIGDDEPIPEGGWGTTANGWRWQRRDGRFYTRSNWTAEELAHADDYYDCPHSRAEIEAEHGPLSATDTGEADRG
jgi:hypothetical protein